MSAQFELRKYVGQDGAFGTPCSKIGIKRIDSCVPAVYGSPIVPADDSSDANMYSIYRSDNEDETVYSFESVFKMILKTPPSNQLSNIRIYPATVMSDSNAPKLFIGCSTTYSRPTNSKSLKALVNLWDYSEETPFCVTVGGNFGQTVNEQLPVTNYNMVVHDIGYGNIIYMNNERQLPIPLLAENGSYSLVNNSTSLMTLAIYDPITLTTITNVDIVVAMVSGNQVITINATTALKDSYPNGLLYGSATSSTVGGNLYWVDFTASPIETITYDVTLLSMPNGTLVYALNGEVNPVLNFRENYIYKFNNLVGDSNPLRFTNDLTAIRANIESKIVIDGVYVENGGTINEVITVKPSEVKLAGKVINSYQSTMNDCYGNTVTNTNTALVGNYNIKTVGAGIYNPMNAGETDYIYLQLVVEGDSTVGQMVPDLVIKYDES